MYDIAHDYYVGLLQQASLSRDATAMIEAQNALSQRTSQYNADVALENSN